MLEAKAVVIDEVDSFLFRPRLGLRAKYHANLSHNPSHKVSSKNQVVSDCFFRALYSKLLLPAAMNSSKLDMNNHLIGPEILSLAEEDVPPDDLVFHRFYTFKMNSSKKTKTKKRRLLMIWSVRLTTTTMLPKICSTLTWLVGMRLIMKKSRR